MNGVKIEKDNSISAWVTGWPSLPDGYTEATMPEQPITEPGQVAVPMWDGSAPYWRIDEVPPPEPQPEPAPTKAEQESRRASAYRDRVDPITCEIQRLRDMGGTEKEIAEAEQRRAEAVRAVKDEYPYPQEGEK